MGVKEDYFRLKKQWIKARGNKRDAVQRELDAFFDSLSESDKKSVNEAVSEDFDRIRKKIDEAKALKREIEVRKVLSDSLPFISVSEFAKQYFGKSASWLHQRINGNEVHGKRASFTCDEIDTLANALKDVANRLTKAASAFAH